MITALFLMDLFFFLCYNHDVINLQGEKDLTDTSEDKGWRFLLLSLLAFAGLGTEFVHFFTWEPLVFGEMLSWESASWKMISHWVATCITWCIVSYFLIRISKNKLKIDIFAKGENMKLLQVIAVFACIVLSVVISYFAWHSRFKLIVEFNNLGWLKFIFQYLYYLVETVIVLLIIVFGQKAFEIWTKKRSIPWGGIVCGLTWGLVHIISRGYFDIQNGIISAVSSLLFGAVYLLTNRDIKKSWLIMFIMFAL